VQESELLKRQGLMNAHVAALRHVASMSDPVAPATVSNFSRTVSELLERTEYRRCDAGEDLEAVYRLRYKSYRTTDMVRPNTSQTIYDAYDDMPNSYKFGIFIDGQLVSTLRLSLISPESPVSPTMAVYGDLLDPILAQGTRLIDPTRFAADAEFSRLHPQIPYLTLRLASMACFHFNAPYCLSTIREEHVGFYRRVFWSEKLGELRSFPGLNYQVVLYIANVLGIRERFFARYPFFQATALEQRMLFDDPSLGERAPLTVLPTAKYIPEAA
jgi:hypothetical protein